MSTLNKVWTAVLAGAQYKHNFRNAAAERRPINDVERGALKQGWYTVHSQKEPGAVTYKVDFGAYSFVDKMSGHQYSLLPMETLDPLCLDHLKPENQGYLRRWYNRYMDALPICLRLIFKVMTNTGERGLNKLMPLWVAALREHLVERYYKAPSIVQMTWGTFLAKRRKADGIMSRMGDKEGTYESFKKVIAKECSSFLITTGNEMFDGLEKLTENLRDTSMLNVVESQAWNNISRMNDPLEDSRRMEIVTEVEEAVDANAIARSSEAREQAFHRLMLLVDDEGEARANFSTCIQTYEDYTR